MHNSNADRWYLQETLNDLSLMVRQLLDDHPNSANIRADMYIMVADARPIAERNGWQVTVNALNSYRVWWLFDMPEQAEV